MIKQVFGVVCGLLFSTLVSAQAYEFRYNGMADVYFSFPPRGSGGRALVHDNDNTLVLNFGGDFSGGTRIGYNFFVGNDGSLRTSGTASNPNSRNSFNSYTSGKALALSNGWITADFGGLGGDSDRLVVGVGYGGKAVIGSYNPSLTSWGGDVLISPEQGNVGIGTPSPKERLSVNGKIRAHEIKVEMSGWPDYVFQPDYKLESLAEIERFIEKNGHLPELPKADEAEKEGVALGEMNKILLKKIEELTLHLIQKDKQMQEIYERLHTLESQK